MIMKPASDRTWKALFKPGESAQHFSGVLPTSLSSTTAGFDLCNAWWLAELSRFVYKLDDIHGRKDRAELTEDLSRVDLSLVDTVVDEPTSTLAALFKFDSARSYSDGGKLNYILAFCGSNAAADWKINIQLLQQQFPAGGKVHRGFYQSFDSICRPLLGVLRDLDASLFITGHSLGAALATLCASWLVNQGIDFDSCYTFGSPRVGDGQFQRSLAQQRIYRVVNNCDIVTLMPVSTRQTEYRHVGESVYFDAQGQYIKSLTEEQVLSRQFDYIPRLKRYLQGDALLTKLTEGRHELPNYLSDHAPVNYVSRISAHIANTN